MTRKKKIVIFIFAVILLLSLWFVYWFFFINRTTQIRETEFITPTTQLPTPLEEKGRGDPDMYEKLQIETQNKYPLLNLTPHRESNWTLDYIGPLRFEITVKGKLTEEIKTEILTWIKNQGVDPDTHQIDWKTSR